MSSRISVVLACTTALLGGCFDNDFADRSIVAQWRALAIAADRPVVRPGEAVRFEPLILRPDGSDALHGTDDITFLWAACARPERIPGLSGLQFNPAQGSQACGDVMMSLPLSVADDGSASLDTGLFIEMLESFGFGIEELPRLASTLLGIPEELAQRLLTDVGIPFVVELRVCEGAECSGVSAPADAIQITAFKRFLLTTGEGGGVNPPPVRFQVCRDDDACRRGMGEWLTAEAGGASSECIADSGTAPVLEVGERVVLDPAAGQDEWLEEYTVLDLQGRFVTVEERAYYSWFSTDGSFDQQVTRAPADEERWTAPDEPGEHPLWVVQRDGHGGTTACRATITVR